MAWSSDRAATAMMGSLEPLGAARSRRDVYAVAASLLEQVFDTDRVLLTRLDLANGTALVRTAPDLDVDRAGSAALSCFGHEHPAVLSYLQPGDDRRPRRVSDVAPLHRWLHTSVYNEAFLTHGERFQLSLVTTLSPTRGEGWVLTRSRRDFSDEDLAAARLVLPYLTLAHRFAENLAPSLRTDDGLSPREESVLTLLATGRSARQIARELGITEATTRKHLTHIYRKLGVPDRLSAVVAVGPPPHLALRTEPESFVVEQRPVVRH